MHGLKLALQDVETTMKGEWIRRPPESAAVVFVHGILSSGETCWKHPNGTFWPALLESDSELATFGGYVWAPNTP